MRTKQEIKDMIKKCKELKKYIPQHPMFEDDNWKKLDDSIKALNSCLKEIHENDIRDRLANIIDSLDDLGFEWSENDQVQAYDWVLGNTDDGPAPDEDIEVFKNKKKG
jgi:hypothetical protein